MVTVLVLLVPSVAAAPPATNLPSAFSLGGQDVSDLAMDPSGQYVAGVVMVDPTRLVPLPGQTRTDDIYPCHFGPPSSAFTGSGCRSPGLQHGTSRRTTQLSARQAVDYTSFFSGGLVARYAVAGPSDTLSLWSTISDTPEWEIQVPGNQAVVNVSLSPDAGRVLAATVPPSGAGRILMYNGTASDGATGVLMWDYNFTDTRPSSMDYARSGAVAAVGTTVAGATVTPEVFVLKPITRKPILGQEIHRFSAAGDVNHVLLSASGAALVVGTAQGVHYVPIDTATGKPADIRSFTQLPGGAQRVALSLDGERFAAASGSKIHFFRFLGGTLISERVGTEFDAGAPVADLAYDATGDLLVAIAGTRVYGFGETRTTPIWSFDASEGANGGLDGPLRKVVVSDGGERIVVAGKTKLMPYRTLLSATATFVQAQRLEVRPASNVQLSITVTNKGSLPDNYTFGTRFPPGWNGVSPSMVHLNPEESAVVNLSLDVPAGQAPGFYGVEVDVRSEAAQRLGREKTIVATPALNLTVPRSIVLNVTTADDRIPSLRQGGEITIPVTVRNRGNAEGVVNLSTTQVLSRGTPWPLRFDAEQVSVPAGGERTVSLIVTAPADAASGDRNDIT
ncbi:MAG TPA: NEW3 domain-containing protein, partial [Candidatus Thermoplasmatota archaeon]|nr:NEW3 domain-containing protein [Candidatus Thermoplasmatota archaeon]